MRTQGVIKALGPIHTTVIQQGVEYFLTLKDLAIAATKFQYQTSNQNIQNKEPFNYENFKLAANRFGIYGALILREGSSWLGCRFWSLVIWHPTPGYQALYEIPEGQT